jgi:hypothetical protein
MKCYLARHTAITKLVICALLTLCLVQPPVGARAPESVVARVTATATAPLPLLAYEHKDGPSCEPCFNTILIGFVPGQTLRISLFNSPASGAGAGSQPTPVHGHIKVFSRDNILLAQSAELVIPPSEFRSFDFNRAALNLPGEPGTGRLQVRARLVLRVAAPSRPTHEEKGAGAVVASWELIDNLTGRTAVAGQPSYWVYGTELPH